MSPIVTTLLASLTCLLLVAATSSAEAGVNAVFGGWRAAVEPTAAVCPSTTPGPIGRLAVARLAALGSAE